MSETVRKARQEIVNQAGDDLTLFGLLQIKSTCAQYLEVFEQFALLTESRNAKQGESNMTIATLEQPTSADIDAQLGVFDERATDAYWQLVDQVASGAEVADSQEFHTMKAATVFNAGKTNDDFRRDVGDRIAWREAVALIVQGDPNEGELAKLNAEAAAIVAEFEVIEKAYLEKTKEFSQRHRAVLDKRDVVSLACQNRIGNARNYINSMLSDDALAEFSKLSNTLVPLGNRVAPLRDTIKLHRASVEHIRDDGSQQERATLPELEEKLAAMEAEFAEVSDRRATAQAEFDRFQNVTLLEPASMRRD